MSVALTVETRTPSLKWIHPQACAESPDAVALPSFMEPFEKVAWNDDRAPVVGFELAQFVASAPAGPAAANENTSELMTSATAGIATRRRLVDRRTELTM